MNISRPVTILSLKTNNEERATYMLHPGRVPTVSYGNGTVATRGSIYDPGAMPRVTGRVHRPGASSLKISISRCKFWFRTRVESTFLDKTLQSTKIWRELIECFGFAWTFGLSSDRPIRVYAFTRKKEKISHNFVKNKT